MSQRTQILVTGGGTFLGDHIAAALLAEGASVTLLVRPGAEARLGAIRERVRWWTADVWEPSSLKGRARGHQMVIHTVGSMTAEPAQGLTYQSLNFVSARNVANMCVTSGVGQMMLISAARAPWIPTEYVRAKREAETYIARIGLRPVIIRAPLVYLRGSPRNPLFTLVSLLARIPILGALTFGKAAPLPVDVLARGIARIALEGSAGKTLYSAHDLRRRNTARERRRGESDGGRALLDSISPASPIEWLDEETPFGWIPPGG